MFAHRYHLQLPLYHPAARDPRRSHPEVPSPRPRPHVFTASPLARGVVPVRAGSLCGALSGAKGVLNCLLAARRGVDHSLCVAASCGGDRGVKGAVSKGES